jgi:hypothetical protein
MWLRELYEKKNLTGPDSIQLQSSKLILDLDPKAQVILDPAGSGFTTLFSRIVDLKMDLL